MKGMIVKDLRLLISQKTTLLIMCIMMIFFTFSTDTAGTSFAATYLVLLSCIVGINTIAYDQADNGYTFLFTLPASRRHYVEAKYIFILCVSLAFCLLSLAADGAIRMIRPSSGAGGLIEWLLGSTTILAFPFYLIAFSIPPHLKFRAEKGRIISLMVVFGLAGSVAALDDMLPDGTRSLLMDLFSWSAGLGPGIWALLFLLVGLILWLISMAVSIRIIEKNEY